MNSLVKELIRYAYEKGERIDEAYATRYIQAREVLERNPNAEGAQRTVNHFQLLLSPFGRFTLPYEDWEKYCCDVDDRSTRVIQTADGPVKTWGIKTDEDAARAVKLYQRSKRQPIPQSIIEKCVPVYRDSDEYWVGGKEGIYGFIDRTGLTIAQIESMTTDELRAYA